MTTPPDDATPLDPVLQRAFERAQRRFERVKDRWDPSGDDESEAEAAEDARAQAKDALAHLEAGRWDEAEQLAQSCVDLDETWGDGETWREFANLVEEVAALGRGGR